MQKAEEMNKMGVEPVKRLLLEMGLPMMISMALQALYNIVDSYFVSCMKDPTGAVNLGDLGVNALTLAFPVQMLMVALPLAWILTILAEEWIWVSFPLAELAAFLVTLFMMRFIERKAISNCA